MIKSFLQYVQHIELAVNEARELTAIGTRAVDRSNSKVLLFSPHPDDECIFGLLPLRLQRESRKEIINIPVTFGSKLERQAERSKELDDACAYLGWDCHHERDDLNSLTVDDVFSVLEKFQPDIIFLPHDDDWNSRHISTHHLIVEALKQMEDFTCLTVETEFWGAMKDPNLMVEASSIHVAELAAATSLHVGEVARNPYHLLLPAWMQDNVRRGGELIGGQGGAASQYSFATLYRLRRWKNGGFQKVLEYGKYLGVEPAENNLADLFTQ